MWQTARTFSQKLEVGSGLAGVSNRGHPGREGLAARFQLIAIVWVESGNTVPVIDPVDHRRFIIGVDLTVPCDREVPTPVRRDVDLNPCRSIDRTQSAFASCFLSCFGFRGC